MALHPPKQPVNTRISSTYTCMLRMQHSVYTTRYLLVCLTCFLTKILRHFPTGECRAATLWFNLAVCVKQGAGCLPRLTACCPVSPDQTARNVKHLSSWFGSHRSSASTKSARDKFDIFRLSPSENARRSVGELYMRHALRQH